MPQSGITCIPCPLSGAAFEGGSTALTILDALGDAIYGIAPDWTFTFFNREAEQFFHRGREEVLGRSVWACFPAAVGTELADGLHKVMATRQPVQATLLSPTTRRWTDTRIFPMEPGGIGVSWRDVTEQKRQAIALHEAIENQDLLFRELAHRVTNNFSEIAARLRLQARDLQDGVARDMCAKMAVSIDCMALVHRRLYGGTGDLRDQDLGAYIEALCTDLKRSILPDAITLHATTIGGTSAPIPVVTTVGMMIAELVMNSAKYAWAPGETGSIAVTMRRDGAVIEVQVLDDGRGIPPGTDLEQASGFGLRLLRRQIARLKGTFSVRNAETGACFQLRFPAPAASAEP